MPRTSHGELVNRIRGAWLALALLACAPLARAQGVQSALVPAQQVVAPGAGFDVELQVTAAGTSFNGFTVVLAYDPAALTFVPASPLSLQQGCLMTGECSVACGATFHDFRAAADSLQMTDILLCNGVLLEGPGALYRLHFIASATPQATTLHVRRAEFYQGGTYVTPVVTADATIGIGVTLSAGDAPPPAALAFSASPNPARGDVAFAFGAPLSADAELRVADVQGRTVSVLHVPAGARLARWDGRGAGGVPAAPGLYLAELRRGARRDFARVTIVR